LSELWETAVMNLEKEPLSGDLLSFQHHELIFKLDELYASLVGD
jgi:hypothetical protein